MKFNTIAVQHDWAFAVIKTGPFSKDRKNRTNGSRLPDIDSNFFTYASAGFNVNSPSTGLGYPAGTPYSGDSLKFAWGLIFTDPSAETWGMPSVLTGGASGGPWLSTPTANPTLITGPDTWESTGSVSSVNSYKYTNNATRMYGPKFNLKTDRTKAVAQADSCITQLQICTSNLVVTDVGVTRK
jgi:hypothetical protein